MRALRLPQLALVVSREDVVNATTETRAVNGLCCTSFPSPAQHIEPIFKQILGGCHSVVQGLGSLRSKLGDAHAQGKAVVKPAPRHAELAVNLAGTMATFLLATWEARIQSEDSNQLGSGRST